MIVKNEGRDLAEWIAYHSLLGFDALIVFDNLSTDNTNKIVLEAAKTISIHYWPWNRSDAKTQTGAYEEACRTFATEFDWIGFFDADEFLNMHRHGNVRDLLSQYDAYAGVAINWAVFGANGHEAYHTDLLIEDFTRRSTIDFFPNHHVKCFVRPGSVSRCPNPHYFEIAGPYCDSLGRPMEWMDSAHGVELPPGLSLREPDYSICQMNHYFTRSRAHWSEKVRRGYPADIAIRKTEEFEIYDRNEVEDRSATRLTSAVRARMAELFKRDAA